MDKEELINEVSYWMKNDLKQNVFNTSHSIDNLYHEYYTLYYKKEVFKAIRNCFGLNPVFCDGAIHISIKQYNELADKLNKVFQE
jgi:hypothetical protein